MMKIKIIKPMVRNGENPIYWLTLGPKIPNSNFSFF